MRNKTSGGIELTDALIERLANEAEQGYDPKRLRSRKIKHEKAVQAQEEIVRDVQKLEDGRQ